MQSRSHAPCMLVGIVLAALGCHAPYNYQNPNAPGYYGQPYSPQYPGGPGYVVPPGQPPSGTYTPGNGIGQPAPLTAPGSTPGTYDNGGINWNTPAQPSQPAGGPNPAPKFNPNAPGTSQPDGSTGNKTVPDPADDPNSVNRPTLQPTSSIQSNERASPFPNPSRPGSSIPPVQVGPEPEELSFEAPVQRTSGVQQTSSLQKANLELATEKASPYGRDVANANPQWLRGVVDYDKRDRTWQIIYAENPDPNDSNGGSLTLGNHRDLAACRNGDVVLVEGAIDGSQTDSRGKPIYILDSVTKLNP